VTKSATQKPYKPKCEKCNNPVTFRHCNLNAYQSPWFGSQCFGVNPGHFHLKCSACGDRSLSWGPNKKEFAQ